MLRTLVNTKQIYWHRLYQNFFYHLLIKRREQTTLFDKIFFTNFRFIAIRMFIVCKLIQGTNVTLKQSVCYLNKLAPVLPLLEKASPKSRIFSSLHLISQFNIVVHVSYSRCSVHLPSVIISLHDYRISTSARPRVLQNSWLLFSGGSIRIFSSYASSKSFSSYFFSSKSALINVQVCAE